MIDAFVKALSQMFAPTLRRVLLKAVGLALIVIVIIGIAMQRLLAVWADAGANWAEQASGMAPHAAWAALAWVLSMIAALGIITGALFLMPVVTAFVGSFFVDEVAEAVEREYYPAHPPGRALPFLRALLEGIKIAALAIQPGRRPGQTRQPSEITSIPASGNARMSQPYEVALNRAAPTSRPRRSAAGCGTSRR